MTSNQSQPTNPSAPQKKKMVGKKFRCELCSLRIPYKKEELTKHVNGRNHINCQVLLEQGQWPGVSAKSESKPVKDTFRVYDFVDEGSGRIKCNVCATQFTDPTVVFPHQRMAGHANEVAKKNAQHKYPTLFHCEICAVKRLYIASRQEFEMHMKTPEHLAKLDDWDRELKQKWEKRKGPKDSSPDASQEDPSIEILFNETGQSSSSDQPADTPEQTSSTGKTVVRLKGLGPELKSSEDILSLCVPYGTVVRHVYLPKDKRALIQFSTNEEANKMKELVSENAPVFSNGASMRVEFTNHDSLKEENVTSAQDLIAAKKIYENSPIIQMPLGKKINSANDGSIPEELTGVPKWQSFFGPVVELGVQLPYMAQKALYLRFGPEIQSDLDLVTLCCPFGTVTKNVFMGESHSGLVEFSKPEEAHRMVLSVEANKPMFSNGCPLVCSYSRQPELRGRDTTDKLQRTAFYNMCNQKVSFTKKPLLPYHQMPLPLPYTYIQDIEEKDNTNEAIDPRLPKLTDDEHELSLTEIEITSMRHRDFDILREDLANAISELHLQRKDYTTPRLAEIIQICDSYRNVPKTSKKREKHEWAAVAYNKLERLITTLARLQYILSSDNLGILTPISRKILVAAKKDRERCKKTWKLKPDFGETIENMPHEVKEALNSCLECLRVQELKTKLPKMIEEYEDDKRHFNRIKVYIQSCKTESELPQLLTRKQKLDTKSKNSLLKTRIAYVVLLGLVECLNGDEKHNITQFCKHTPQPREPESELDPYNDFDKPSKDDTVDQEEDLASIGTFADTLGTFTDISFRLNTQEYCMLCRKDVRGEGGLTKHAVTREHKCMLVLAAHHCWPGRQVDDCVPQKVPKIYVFNQSDMLECSVCQLTVTTSIELLRHQRGQTHAHKLRMRKFANVYKAIMYCEVCEVFFKLGNQVAFSKHLSSSMHREKVRNEEVSLKNTSNEESIPKEDIGTVGIPSMVSEEQIRGLSDHYKCMLEFSLRPLVGDTAQMALMSSEMRTLRSIRPNMTDYLTAVRDRDDTGARLKRLETAEAAGTIEKGSSAQLRQKFSLIQERVEICLLKDQVNFAVHHGILNQLPPQAKDIIFGLLHQTAYGSDGEKPSTSSQPEIIEIGAPKWSPHDRAAQTQLPPDSQPNTVLTTSSSGIPGIPCSSAPNTSVYSTSALANPVTLAQTIATTSANLPIPISQASLQQSGSIDIKKILETLMPDHHAPPPQPETSADPKLEIVKEIIAQREAAKARQKEIDAILLKLSGGVSVSNIPTAPESGEPSTSQEPQEQPEHQPPTTVPPGEQSEEPQGPEAKEEGKKWESSLEESLRRARWRAREIAITDVWDTPRMCWVWDGDDVENREYIMDCSAFFRELEAREETPEQKKRRALQESVAAAQAALAVPVPQSSVLYRDISDDDHDEIEEDPDQPGTSRNYEAVIMEESKRRRRSSSPEVIYEDQSHGGMGDLPAVSLESRRRKRRISRRRNESQDVRIVLARDSPGNQEGIEDETLTTVSDIEEISEDEEAHHQMPSRGHNEDVSDDEYFSMARDMGGWTPPEEYRTRHYSPPGSRRGPSYRLRREPSRESSRSRQEPSRERSWSRQERFSPRRDRSRSRHERSSRSREASWSRYERRSRSREWRRRSRSRSATRYHTRSPLSGYRSRSRSRSRFSPHRR